MHFILGTVTGEVIYSWKTAPGVAPAIPFINLKPEHLLDYIGLKTSSMSPAKTYIFSFRLCLTAGPREWLRNPNTKRNLEYHDAELSLSNVSSHSGNTTTAAFIFFIHRTITHCFFYLKELCKRLSPAAPFFNISLNTKNQP
jgi:hypothetical protein